MMPSGYGIVIAEQVLLHRAAGRAVSDRVARRSKLFDEVFLDHFGRLGRNEIGAARAGHVERAADDRVALGQKYIVKGGSRVFQVEGRGAHSAHRSALVVPGLASAAETVDQAPVVTRRSGERIRQREGRVMQDGDHVDRAIDRAHLPANDVRNRQALVRCRHCKIGRPRAGRIEGLEAVGRRRPVVIVDARGCAAVGIERRPETLKVGLTYKRCLVRAREHRPRAGIVRNEYFGERLSGRARTGTQHVRAHLQPADEAPQ